MILWKTKDPKELLKKVHSLDQGTLRLPPRKLIARYDKIAKLTKDASEPELCCEAAKALYYKGSALKQLGRVRDALVTYDEVVSRYGGLDHPKVQKWVVNALCAKLRDAGPNHAIVEYREILKRAGGIGSLERSLVLDDFFGFLQKLDSREEKLGAYDKVVELYAGQPHPAMQEASARALFLKGKLLATLDRRKEGSTLYVEIARLFGASTDPRVLRWVVQGMLEAAENPKQTMAACDEIARRFGHHDDEALRRQIADVLLEKADLLFASNRHDEAGNTFDDVISRLDVSDNSRFLAESSLARAFVGKARLLSSLGHHAQAANVYEKVFERFGEDGSGARSGKSKALLHQVAIALSGQAEALLETTEPHDTVIHKCGAFLDTFDKPDQPELQPQTCKVMVMLASAIHRKANYFHNVRYLDNARGAYERVIERFDKSTLPECQDEVAKARAGLALIDKADVGRSSGWHL